MNLPELLAPAGNMDRLKAAFRYGADACYLGITRMSLRNFADNFTIENLKEAVNIAHDTTEHKKSGRIMPAMHLQRIRIWIRSPI